MHAYAYTQVSAYKPEERYPGGDFPNQRPPSKPDGLAAWTARDASLEATDLVVWHVFGVTHAVRLHLYLHVCMYVCMHALEATDLVVRHVFGVTHACLWCHARTHACTHARTHARTHAYMYRCASRTRR